MELALSLEKLNFQKLRELHDVAGDANDAQMCDFIEGTLLAPQVCDPSLRTVCMCWSYPLS
jgi:ferritin heavy chain